MGTYIKPAMLSVEQRIASIINVVKAEEQRLREKYPILRFQDWIGFGIMLFSLAGMVAGGYFYYIDVIPAWVCIISAAIFASLSHELEHDLIHRQYFRRNRFLHNLMMLVVWIMRPNTVNPWYRRSMHFLHHKTSGTPDDLEERLVGNGLKQNFSRYLVMFDGLLGLLVRGATLGKEMKTFSFVKIVSAGFPFAIVHFVCWYLFLGFHAYDFLANNPVYPEWLSQLMVVVDFAVVVLVAPNFIRSGSLNFVTSHMHYYGGVTNLLQQTQILKHWLFAPMHLFCFNFGATHAIHHIVVGQPFYIRQMVAKAAHKVMLEHGVRLNDFSTFAKGNRFQAI